MPTFIKEKTIHLIVLVITGFMVFYVFRNDLLWVRMMVLAICFTGFINIWIYLDRIANGGGFKKFEHIVHFKIKMNIFLTLLLFAITVIPIVFLVKKYDNPNLNDKLSWLILAMAFALMIMDKVISLHGDHPRVEEVYKNFDIPIFFCIMLVTLIIYSVEFFSVGKHDDLLMFGAGANAFQAILATLMFDPKDLDPSDRCTKCQSVIDKPSK